MAAIPYIIRDSSHEGYIDFGVKPQNDIEIEIKFMPTNSGSGLIIGAPSDDDSNDFRIFFSNERMYYDCGKYRYISDSTYDPFWLNEILNIRFGNNYLYNNYIDQQISNSSTADTLSSISSNVQLFQPKTRYGRIDYGQVYSVKISVGGDVVVDAIPYQLDDGNGTMKNNIDGTIYEVQGGDFGYNEYEYSDGDYKARYTLSDEASGEIEANGSSTLTVAEVPNNIKTIEIGNCVTSLGEDCLHVQQELTSVTISSSVESIGSKCFSYCTKLQNILVPNSVTTIGERCWIDCSALSSVTMSDNVQVLSDYCFYGCYKLNNFTISDKVTDIRPFCFAYSSFDGIVIPSNVKSLGDSSFRQAKTVYMESSIPPTNDGAFDLGYIEHIYTPCGSSSTYKNAEGWSNYADYIADNTDCFETEYRWTLNGTVCDGFDLYEKEVYQVSENGGETWENVVPEESRKGDLIEQNSESCGYVNEENNGICKYYKQQRYVSYDDGKTWAPLQEFRQGGLYEYRSESCGNNPDISKPLLPYQMAYTLVDGTEGKIQCGITDEESRYNKGILRASYKIIELGDCFDEEQYDKTMFSAMPNLIQFTYSPYSTSGIYRYGVTSCPNLKTLNLPSNITEVRSLEFCGNLSLESVEIPKSVKTFYINAFAGCINLKSMTFEPMVPPYLYLPSGFMEGRDYFNFPEGFVIYVPSQSLEVYKTSDNWAYFSDIIYPIS